MERAEQEKKAAIIRAEGEAESADVVSKALAKAGDGLLMIRRLRHQRTLHQHWPTHQISLIYLMVALAAVIATGPKLIIVEYWPLSCLFVHRN